MNEKLRMIINHYGIRNQLKHFQSEVYELNEAILIKNNSGVLENVIDGISRVLLTTIGSDYTDYRRNHIKEEIADVMVMLCQFKEHYHIDGKEIMKIMNEKIDRQLKRIGEEQWHTY